MNKNIKVTVIKGEIFYETISTDNLKLPTMLFDRFEDAELAVLIAKALYARNEGSSSVFFDDILNGVKYTFRALGLNDSQWVK